MLKKASLRLLQACTLAEDKSTRRTVMKLSECALASPGLTQAMVFHFSHDRSQIIQRRSSQSKVLANKNTLQLGFQYINVTKNNTVLSETKTWFMGLLLPAVSKRIGSPNPFRLSWPENRR